MQVSERINAIENRAAAINLTLHEVCREAHIWPSTIARWRTGQVDPKVGKVARTIADMEAVLDRHEARLRSHLRSSSGGGVALAS